MTHAMLRRLATPSFALLPLALLAGCSDKPRNSEQETARDDIVTRLDEDVPPADEPVAGKQKPSAGTMRTIAAGPVPARFRGEWRTSAKNCGDASDSMGLTITATQLIYYESEGKVRRATSTGPGQLSITADYTGEGDSWTKQSSLRLTDAGALVLDGVTRVRCR